MEDLSKVSSIRLYLLLKNFAVAMLVVVVAITGSRLLPDYLAPVLTLGCAAYLYYRIMRDKMQHQDSCSIVNYTMFLSMIVFTFFIVILNILYSFKLLHLPPEMVFLSPPFIPSLVVMPICLCTSVAIYLRRKKLRMCLNCHVVNGDVLDRGRTGSVINQESNFQMRNMIVLFLVMSAIIWAYYLLVYVNINQNARDWYVFTWMVIIGIILDLCFMMGHYYSLSQALEDQGLLITLEEITNMPKQTFMRFYIICGEYLLVQEGLTSKYDTFKDHIDTPVKGVISNQKASEYDALALLRKKTGLVKGELRFFYGREYHDFEGMSLNRYFYFLDGNPEDYQELAENLNGEWVHFNHIKEIYTKKPRGLKRVFLADMNRLATIMITRKMFDEKGNRKFKIKSYLPSFTLQEVRDTKVDFQSDKWMKIAVYNSDIFAFRMNKWLKKQKGNKTLGSWTLM